MRILLTALLCVFSLPLLAADLELGIRHLGTAMRGESAFDGGKLDIAASRGFAATAEVFWSERVSTQVAATFINPETILFPAAQPPSDVDLNTLGVDTYSASARWHVAPRSRWCPFAGAGVALVTFGNLEQRFGDDIEMNFDAETAFFAETGLRFRFRPSVILDAAVSYMPLEVEPSSVRNTTTVVLPSRLSLDPLTVSVGAAWRV
jgi:hypothetical protein